MIPANIIPYWVSKLGSLGAVPPCQAPEVKTPSAQRHDYDKTMPGPTKGSRPMKDTFVRKVGCES
jgi:hypothetical protein